MTARPSFPCAWLPSSARVMLTGGGLMLGRCDYPSNLLRVMAVLRIFDALTQLSAVAEIRTLDFPLTRRAL